jgi:hypothetical protein
MKKIDNFPNGYHPAIILANNVYVRPSTSNVNRKYKNLEISN